MGSLDHFRVSSGSYSASLMHMVQALFVAKKLSNQTWSTLHTAQISLEAETDIEFLVEVGIHYGDLGLKM